MAAQDEHLRRLIAIGTDLFADLDPEAVLGRVLDRGREVTGARYAGIGMLGVDGERFERFRLAGLEDGRVPPTEMPRLRPGVLGELVDDARPLRLDGPGVDPAWLGFPPGHGPIQSFLGVPILIGTLPWGILFLADKADGVTFDESDEDAMTVLAQLAATAIQNARAYAVAERDRQELTLAVRGLEAARSIADAVSTETRLERILELIVERGRELVDARAVLILLHDGDDLIVAAGTGEVDLDRPVRLPVGTTTSGEALRRGVTMRFDDVTHQLRLSPEAYGVEDAHTALLVPMIHRTDQVGVLAAYDRGPGREPFSDRDELVLGSFAASAATAVAMSRSVENHRLRAMMTAADEERRRWARELHDATLQSLGALRLLLASARSGDPRHLTAAVDEAVEQLDGEIAEMRALISDLRPPMLDDLGLVEALSALAGRRRRDGLDVSLDLDVAQLVAAELTPELEGTIFRVVQEALTNTIKHAAATRATVRIHRLPLDRLAVEIEDDGVGFDPSAATEGFGLMGLRERVYLAGGKLKLVSAAGGSCVQVRLPLRTGRSQPVQPLC